MYHAIIEQTKEYKNRVKFDPTRNIFYETEFQSLAYVRNFHYPYGWIKELGTPPGHHLDVILLSLEAYKLGEVVPVKIVGCFLRSDGDHKLIAVLPERPETDFSELSEDEKTDLSRLYPVVGDGEGWYGAERAKDIIEEFIKNR